jgi:hypothetical protein
MTDAIKLFHRYRSCEITRITKAAETAKDERRRRQRSQQRPHSTEDGTGSGDFSIATDDRTTLDADSPALGGVEMQSRKYDHVLTLKITSGMRGEIDEALARMNGLSVETRSEFLGMAAAYALASILEGCSKHQFANVRPAEPNFMDVG